MGRYVANLIVGKLTDEGPSKAHLLACKILERANHATISRFINDNLCKTTFFMLNCLYLRLFNFLAILWPSGIQHEKVKLYYSDAAAYMVKSATSLKIFYPNLIHVTCLAHALNLVCEVIRNEYEGVNGLIANVKKVF